MLKVGIIGAGNAGNQVVATAFEKEVGVDLFAINCSETDLKTLPDAIPKALIGDGNGAGKNREDSKKFLGAAIQDFIYEEDVKKFITGLDILFIVSSTGGGTGSGIVPVLTAVIKQVYPTVYPIPIGIVSALKEGLSTHENSLEYFMEIRDNLKDSTCMVYDNEVFTDCSNDVMMKSINERIVDDIVVLSGYYNFITKYASIDNKDLLNIIKTPGRLVVGRAQDFKEKDIDEKSVEAMLLEDVRTGGHAELQKDGLVNRIGVITNVSEFVSSKIDTMVPEVQKVVGTPVEVFEHIGVNNDRKFPNNVFLILSGLSMPNNRISEIKEKANALNDMIKKQKQRLAEEEDVFADVDAAKLRENRVYAGNQVSNGKVDLQNIFASFGSSIPVRNKEKGE